MSTVRGCSKMTLETCVSCTMRHARNFDREWLVKLLPMEFGVPQQIYVDYEGQEHDIWSGAKNIPDENAESKGKPLVVVCDLGNERISLTVNRGTIFTRCRWDLEPDEKISIGAASITPGKSGGLGVIKRRSAFGLCMYGEGIYQGHAIMVFRDTNAKIDWLSNASINVARSELGQSVHNGFHDAFKSIHSKVRPFVSSLGKNKIVHVHCIGHSLGAPRVGLQTFADMLTSQLKPKCIFRVYRQTDIAPCIPFWPFVHAPTFPRVLPSATPL